MAEKEIYTVTIQSNAEQSLSSIVESLLKVMLETKPEDSDDDNV